MLNKEDLEQVSGGTIRIETNLERKEKCVYVSTFADINKWAISHHTPLDIVDNWRNQLQQAGGDGNEILLMKYKITDTLID